LPDITAPEVITWDPNTTPEMRMLQGEQLLLWTSISDTGIYQMYTGVLGDDIIALGMPGKNGGTNVINMDYGFAISTGSLFKDEAWDFIRQLLLPDLNTDLMWGFPLRHDLFDKMIAKAKTPFLILDMDSEEFEEMTALDWISYRVYDADRNKAELSQSSIGLAGIFAMTESEERGLRDIVENARFTTYFDETVLDMVREETPRFFSGDRSAADTARVIQNRIQTFLNERG